MMHSIDEFNLAERSTCLSDEKQANLTWPVNYSVRVSQRAKYVSMRIVRMGLEVIVPNGFNRARLPDILLENKAWIVKHLKKSTHRIEETDQTCIEPPGVLELLAINRVWRVEYLSTGVRARVKELSYQLLCLYGAHLTLTDYHRLLCRWVRKLANLHLTGLLQQISLETGLAFESVSIRGQRTRWGSCSSDKKINLNFKLMFLRPELVRYVLIHELCHTVYMDHSKRFWQLVEQFDKNWRRHRNQLRNVNGQIPGWAEKD